MTKLTAIVAENRTLNAMIGGQGCAAWCALLEPLACRVEQIKSLFDRRQITRS